MKCPRCESVVLDEADRSGITVDRCPSCRGIWLDRGELEKLMAREAGMDERRYRDRDRHDFDDDDDDDRRRYGRQGRGEGGLFGSLRDIFD